MELVILILTIALVALYKIGQVSYLLDKIEEMKKEHGKAISSLEIKFNIERARADSYQQKAQDMAMECESAVVTIRELQRKAFPHIVLGAPPRDTQ